VSLENAEGPFWDLKRIFGAYRRQERRLRFLETGSTITGGHDLDEIRASGPYFESQV